MVSEAYDFLYFSYFSLFFPYFLLHFLVFFLIFSYLGPMGPHGGALGPRIFSRELGRAGGARAKKSGAPGPPHGAPWAPSKKKLRKKQENEATNKEKQGKVRKIQAIIGFRDHGGRLV